MKLQKRQLLTLPILLLTLILALPAASFAKSYDKIIAFGDSLSDHHGLESYLGAYDPVSNPNGALEAWTNGDVWVEYLADILNADLDNNAIAGAMTEGHENGNVQALSDAGQLPQLGLIGQVNLFASEDLSYLSGDTLFTIWIGGNDLLKFGKGESDAPSVDDLITDAIDNIINSMSALAAEGAVNLLIINLPDLGKSPAYNTKTPAEIAAASSLSFAFNSALENGISNFRKAFPAVNVVTFDVFSFLNQIINDDVFENSTGTYMVLDENGDRTGATNEPAEDYLFWDTIHPTAKAHQLVAIEVADTLDEEDDDDDSCFISSVSAAPVVSNLYTLLPGIFMVIGIGGWLIKRD